MMIKITDAHIKDGQLDKAALAEFGADVVEFEGDKITFKTYVEFSGCNSLTSIEGTAFNGNVEFVECDSLVSVSGATFNGNVEFSWCDSLASVSGATFKKGFKAISCPNLKQ